MRELWRRLNYYLHRERFEAELDEEMAYHRERSGAKQFGNTTRLKEESRAAWGWMTLENVARDLRHGVRQLRRSPGFAAVAILSLALGTGANTAVFQLLNAVRLRSLPVPAPQELVEIQIAGGTNGFGRNTGWNSLTYPVWEQVSDNQEAFEGVFAWARTQMELGEDDATRTVEGAWVTGEAFPSLGVAAERGRLLGPADAQSGCGASAVISHGLWQREFGGLDSAIGSQLVVRGRPVTVIGVTPREFFGIEVGRKVEVFMPFCVLASWSPGILQSRDLFWVGAMGRLRSDWNAERAASHLEAASAGWFEAVAPSGYEASWMDAWSRFRLTAQPRPNGISVVREAYESSLWLLLGITALVLLIATANLANLMLARSSARRREISVRMAIGASRGRVLWQLFWESLLVAFAGALAGVGLATFLSRVLIRFIRSQQSFLEIDLPVDWRVLLFVAATAIAVCLGLALSTGLLVIRAQGRSPVTSVTRDGQSDRHGLAFQRPLIAVQVAVAFVLVASSLLFVRSFQNLFTLDTGFRQEGIAFHFLDFGPAGVEPERIRPLLRDVLAGVRSTTGVAAAATSTHMPLSGSSFWLAMRTERGEESSSQFTWVNPGYFGTMEIPILSGRDFTDLDDVTSPRVLLVNETFARRYFDGADPIGQVVRSLAEPNYPETQYEVVGVVADTRYLTLREDLRPIAYAPDLQVPVQSRPTVIVTRSPLPAADIGDAVRAAVALVEPAIDVQAPIDLRAESLESMARERMLSWIAGFFGILALGLASIGLYGVVSCVVAGRRHEIGIRMALGATRSGVAWMILQQVAVLLVVGLALGMVATLGLSRAARTLLFELEPNDPLTLAISAALLAIVAVWASLIPARRASRIDPNVSLQHE